MHCPCVYNTKASRYLCVLGRANPMKSSLAVRFAGMFCLLLLFALGGRAQDTWNWPEKPKNLQVLPKDWPGTRLRPVMIGFTRALGVRCSYCHKGDEGKPLSTYDFASDENPNKNRAREMYRMLGDIEDHLKKIEPSGDKRVNMWCHTCHHGRAAFDFGEGSLNVFGYTLLEGNDAAGAIKIFQLNAETFPDSSNVWDSLAEGYLKAGDVKKAQENYEKALGLDPSNPSAKEA